MSAQETDVLQFTDDNLQCLIDCIQDELSNVLDTDSYYPIGYIYRTSKAPADGGDPNDLFPGTTWVRLTDAYVRAAGDNDIVDNDPEHDTPHGSNTRTAADLPIHLHDVSKYTGTAGALSSFPSANRNTFVALVNDAYKESSRGSFAKTNIPSATWYGTAYNNQNNTKWGDLTISPPYHNHTVPNVTDKTTTGVTNMDIQPKHLYKYYWERTA